MYISVEIVQNFSDLMAAQDVAAINIIMKYTK